jgi:signal transduction histidine kinase
MVIKETFNNIVKHSGATEVLLRVNWQAQRLVVVVSDNGKGFDQTRLTTVRNGLANMFQRMEELGGTFEITSQPGKGCRTELSLPLKPLNWSLRKWSRKLKRSLPPAGKEASAVDTLQIHDYAKL